MNHSPSSLVFRGLLASLCIIPSLAAANHNVPNFNWVSALNSVYNGDPENTVTFTADAAGTLDLSSVGTISTPGPLFNALALGSETTGIGDVESYNYTFTFDEPVTALSFFVVGMTNNASNLEAFSNFSTTPDTVTNINNQTWDGSTLSSTSTGSQGQLTFNGPLTSLSFTYTGAGDHEGSSFSGMSWTTIPEPSTGLLCGLCSLLFLKRRRS